MDEIQVAGTPLDALATLLPAERAERLAMNAARAREALAGRVIWHVSSTAQGGGVAELLRTLLAYANGAGVVNRWLVLEADAEFFTITKRLHNHLHGKAGDGGSLARAEHDHYRAVLARNLLALRARVSPDDVVVLHDPQTAALVQGVRALGARTVWRCHVGRDEPNALTDIGWQFLRPYLAGADAHVFSRRRYAPEWVDASRLWVIAPSIDPRSPKNISLAPDGIERILTRAGLVTDRKTRPTARGLVLDGSPPTLEDRLVVQVSRWDRLKDMPGVLAGFASMLGEGDADGAHLVLAGPQASGVADDPEAGEVFSECRRLRQELPAAARDHTCLALLPMADVEENALLVNALQRHADVVVQKSLVEGFGLTVTEAMWKARPVIASRVGGIADQITDGRDGILLDDPTDSRALALATRRLLRDVQLAQRLGAAAHARVLEEYVGDRHLEQYVELLLHLVKSRESAG